MGTDKHTPGPWELCRHLQSKEADEGCSCGYRGVVYGPDTDVPMAICQPGHDPEPAGQEGLGPQRYPRAVELANARLIAAAPDLLEACELLLATYGELHALHDLGECEASVKARAALSKATGEQ